MQAGSETQTFRVRYMDGEAVLEGAATHLKEIRGYNWRDVGALKEEGSRKAPGARLPPWHYYSLSPLAER